MSCAGLRMTMAENSWPPSQAPPPGDTPCSSLKLYLVVNDWRFQVVQKAEKEQQCWALTLTAVAGVLLSLVVDQSAGNH